MKYGNCSCGEELEAVWYTEEESKVVLGSLVKTGRVRNAVSHLVCACGKNYTVSDTFDGPWFLKGKSK